MKKRFVAMPNLPASQVSDAVVSAQNSELLAALENLGISCRLVSPCVDVMPQVSEHADMLFLHLGGKKYAAEGSQSSLVGSLDKLGFAPPSALVSLSCAYPQDVLLNCCIIGKKVIARENNLPWLNGFEAVTVKQGYSKCSVAVVDEFSLITDDESISVAAAQAGLDALLVQKGSVRLNGFDYGFIGGCCGKISQSVLAFCGDITTHSDCSAIKSFCSYRGVEVLSLLSGSLVDVGSILPICEVNN